MRDAKAAENLSVADFEAHPVWQFVNDDAAGETRVRPLRKLPARDLRGKLIGTRVRLANGESVWALVGNISSRDPRRTEHVVTLSIEREGVWFHLARYHDYDYAERGPEALAQFLHHPADDVFPMTFDVREFAEGDPAALAGIVRKDPRERLSRAEIIATSVR